MKKLFAFVLTAVMAAVLVSAPTGCSDKKETKKETTTKEDPTTGKKETTTKEETKK